MGQKTEKQTPLMRQYEQIKAKYPDALLLFRVGDFYETFGEDAVRTAKILGIVLTNRNNGGDRTELAGFPHHSLNTYLPKLVKAGQRVAICDQLEDPKLTKTIVKRGVTELVTPGVAFSDDVLQSNRNNFLAALHLGRQQMGIAFLDVSTGEFLLAQGKQDYIEKLLQNFSPSEVLICKQQRKDLFQRFGQDLPYFPLEEWIFREDYAVEILQQHFKTNSLKGFGVDELQEGTIAAGVALHYLSETQHHKLSHIGTIKRVTEDHYVWMDRFTLRNLELYQSQVEGGTTLLDVLDQTLTPMGGRMLKRWLAFPLKDLAQIQSRHEAVEQLFSKKTLKNQLRQELKLIGDLERLISKVATAKIGPREVIQLKNSLNQLLPIKELLANSNADALRVIGDNLLPCEELRKRISSCLREEAPSLLSKGNVIAPGYSQELDELLNLARNSKGFLDSMLERESVRTGISSLKISSNNVFGYYIEVRNAHKDKVPPEWIRKQTLVNAERYITEELKEYETKILGAEEKISLLEHRLFQELVEWMASYIAAVQQNAHFLSQLDVLTCFAHIAERHKYVRPLMDNAMSLDIREGRHPVIENKLPLDKPYVANDLFLDRETQQVLMITGPNMSGKSALLRQTALIVLMAQMGSFVPAKEACIGIVDKIFTRVGASDNISMGESTFMVEMNETAAILNNLTERSLILLDEIGRGTSTYDGVSIAWAIAEFLHEHPSRAKTLFATHYHELNEMSEIFPRIKNYNVSVKELKDNVIFLRKLVEGGSQHSFGIHVARMAGMPQSVLSRANTILKKLEKTHSSEALTDKVATAATSGMQLSFFQLDDPLLEDIKQEILNTDIDTLTPVEALMKLNGIKRLLTGKSS